MTTPYSETVQGEWYQFDPNVHYYYDEQGQLHYYDPNTNQECDYQPHYNQQQAADNAYYQVETSIPQSYTPIQQQQTTPNYAELPSSRLPTPDVFLPCPEPTCNGENKPKSKFCEECGRPLGAMSRSATPATSTPLTTLTNTFSQQQIQDYNTNYHPPQQDEQFYQHAQPPLERPPTAPVYSSTSLDSANTIPIYHPSSAGSTFDPRHQPQLYYNGAQHQSMQDLYGASQPQEQLTVTRQVHNNTTAYNNVQQQQYQPQQPGVDQLDRARGCPIVTFGFGGKMLVTFPRTVTNYYSTTVKPQPGPIQIKYLKDIIKKPVVSFPGPVLGDSKVGTKQKKKDVGVFMAQMLDKFEKDKQATANDTLEYEQFQAKILLWQLVKVLVENEGSINDK
jgi:hypothetical protein